ncbi:prenyltransferase/squalene oxidase repeat-containing protein [Aureliella helgolandensis]|uniref:Prenyltransferase and squalene oxidase repeat protein n=1 Tax=Aureliella helgolandensis TaxID=2527968 RepID=A0A518G664_9BACT|nr:prenyltransferase/squalene oxidase repeat-containing protein [Aureliella helgolandensis]QDV24072.1 Prenyltransferase and squalene oxidase repeat protein [Aureliella helgolandensis]
MKPALFILVFCAIGKLSFSADVETTVRRGLERLQRASVNWQSNEDCFSCHHHTLPMLASFEGAQAGLQLDSNWMQAQADAAHSYFEPLIEDMDMGSHVPGGAATVGYGLWALSLDQRVSDETTTAMVNYLLLIQGVARLRDNPPADLTKLNNGRWIASCRRAPMQASMVGDTVLALVGIERYATVEQQPRVALARTAAVRWLASAPLTSQQDRLWRLWGLQQLGGDEDAKALVQQAILNSQQSDGGWAESEERPSDALSTGQAVFMLCDSGIAPNDPAIARGRDFLLQTQHADGSWKFESHAEPVQPFFDNGDPHGKHQFISVAATAWATSALAQLMPTNE